MERVNAILNQVVGTIQGTMNILDNDEASLKGFAEIDKGNGNVTVKRVYDFINPVGKRSQLTTFDSEVIRITETIGKALLVRDKAGFIICRELYHMKESGKLEKMGFKSIGEFGKAMFDLSPVTCNQYSRIGEYFIDDNYNPVGEMPKLSVSHYIELLSFIEKKGGSVNEVQDMFLNGTLVDGMSTKKMREALNKAKEKKNTIETSFTEDEAEQTNEVEQTNETEQTNEAEQTSEVEQTNEAEQTNDFDKGATLQKGLDAIQTLYRVSESLKNNGYAVNFIEALDKVMEGIKELF